jgi:hypothetical protein
MKDYHANIGKSIKVALAIRDIKNIELAEHFNVLPQQVIRWKNMEDHSFHRIQDFCAFFNMSVDEFVRLGSAKG